MDRTYAEGGQLKFYRAVGCDKCNKTWYEGCVGFHELMIADDRAKKLIQECARVAELFASAVNSGMRTLKNGRDGKGINGTDRFEDGSGGVYQVTQMSSLFEFLLFMSLQPSNISTNMHLATGFDTFATWHATCKQARVS